MTTPTFTSIDSRRQADVPGALATFLSIAGILLLFSGVAFLRQSASRSQVGQELDNPIHPRYLYLLFVVLSGYLLLLRSGTAVRRKIPTKLIFTCSVFCAYSTLASLLTPSVDIVEFGYRFEFMVMLVVFIFVFSRISNIQLVFSVVRIIVLLECALHVIVFLFPRYFPAFREFNRVSGLWANPNVAAFFIAGALPLAVAGQSSRARIFIYCATFCGVLATLSRGGLVVWTVVFTLSALLGRGKTQTSRQAERIFFSGVVGLSVLFGSAIASSNLMTWLAVASGDLIARLSTTRDFAANERLYVAKLAWQKFLENPVFGSGIGYTLSWSYGASTHNMFLLTLVEQGIVGFSFMLFWLFSMLDFGKTAGILALGFFIPASIFSHNLFDAQYSLVLALYWLSAYLDSPATAISRQPSALRETARPA